MPRLLRLACVAACVALPAHAQQSAAPGAPGRLVGEVFDSLFTRAPLTEATVLVDGLDRIITTDARGRFTVDSVPAGNYRLTFFHPSLDQAGLTAPTTAAVVRAGEATVLTLATPSVATVAKRVCSAAGPTPAHLVFGAVARAGDGTPVPNALVRATWLEVALGRSGAKPTRGGLETRSSETGGFVLCDVPGDVESRVLVDAGDGSIGVATFWPGSPGAHAITVRVPPVGAAGRGRSVVLNAQGAPIANATIGAGSDSTTRSDATGSFTMKWQGHPTTDLVVRALGMQPLTLPGDEFAAPPTAVAVTMDEAGKRLASVDVRSTRSARWFEEFEARRKAGLGSYVTRADIDRRNPSQAWQMLFGVPGMQVAQNGRVRSLYPGSLGACEPAYWVDGVRFADVGGNAPGPLALIQPTEIEAMEVYPRATGVPSEFGGSSSACGVVVIWTRKGGGRR